MEALGRPVGDEGRDHVGSGGDESRIVVEPEVAAREIMSLSNVSTDAVNIVDIDGFGDTNTGLDLIDASSAGGVSLSLLAIAASMRSWMFALAASARS